MRIENVSNRIWCPWCQNEALVMIGTRPAGAIEAEMYGPCPHCEMGFRVEFPAKGRGPWGHDGYWQGMEVEIPEPESENYFSKTENHMRLKLLMLRWAGKGADPLVVLYEPDERERFRLLSEALKKFDSRPSV